MLIERKLLPGAWMLSRIWPMGVADGLFAFKQLRSRQPQCYAQPVGEEARRYQEGRPLKPGVDVAPKLYSRANVSVISLRWWSGAPTAQERKKSR